MKMQQKVLLGTAFLLGALVIVITLLERNPQQIQTQQAFQMHEGVKMPTYTNHKYKNGSVAAQPGVRIYTPSGNTIIVSIHNPDGKHILKKDPAKEMNGWVSSCLKAYTAESIEATTYNRGNAVVFSYNLWRKPNNESEIKSELQEIISVNWKAFYSTKVVDVHSLLTKGDIKSDLETIQNLTSSILNENKNLGKQVGDGNAE